MPIFEQVERVLVRSDHSATVFVLHGLGDTCDGWSPIVKNEWCTHLPYVKFILPTAPYVQSKISDVCAKDGV